MCEIQAVCQLAKAVHKLQMDRRLGGVLLLQSSAYLRHSYNNKAAPDNLAKWKMTMGPVVFTICEFARRVLSEEQQRWKITGVPGALKETQEYPVGFGRALVQPCAVQIN